MKKRGLLLLTACMMTIGMLAGCSSDNEQAESAQQSDQSDQAADETGPDTETNTDNTSGGAAADGKKLVVYYSATGNTEAVADYIADITGGDLFELEPAEPYTDDDLDYNDRNSRVSQEYADESLRDVELVSDTVEGFDEYEDIFIGYPIWWGEAAWPVDQFIETNDFTGKTVIPFCTSASSGIGDSGQMLEEMAGTGEWLEGERFPSGVSEEDVRAWVENLQL